MTMAYEVADEYRAHLAGVISVDGTCRPQFVADDDQGHSRSCCARRAGDGASAPCSTRASTSTASRWSARRTRRSTCSCVPAPTRSRSARSSSSGPHDACESAAPAPSARRAGSRSVSPGSPALPSCSAGCWARPPGHLREQLKAWQFWSLDAVRAARRARRHLHLRRRCRTTSTRRDVVRMAAVAALGVVPDARSSRHAPTASSTTSRSTRASARTWRT